MSERQGNRESNDLSEGDEVQSQQPRTDISTDDEWHSSQNTMSWESSSGETDPEENDSFSDQTVLTENNDRIFESVSEGSGHSRRISDGEPPNVPVIQFSPRQDNSEDSNVESSSSSSRQSSVEDIEESDTDERSEPIGIVETRSDNDNEETNGNIPERCTGNTDDRDTDENGSDIRSNDSYNDTSDTESDLSSDDRASVAESNATSDNESVDNRPVDNVGFNVDLYDGAPVTVEESLISILNFALRHKTTKAQLADTLKLIELHCPPQNNCKKTIHSFEKFFSDLQTPLIRHHYCSVCLRNIGSNDSVCELCNEETTIKYFIEVPIIDQLRALYKRPGFRDMLQYRFSRNRQNHENYEDIFDGAVYKDLCGEGGFLTNRDNISLMWYADGFRVYKSSKFSIWAVYLQINELPLSERTKKENVILVALWFGDEKPIPNLLLKPARDSLRVLRQGIDVEIPELQHSIFIKGIVICGTCDLPAKALFLNMTQYNGKFGCQKCKQRGEYLREDRVFVYPFETFTLRTDEETRAHAQEAWETETTVYGVKGPTILSSLVHENIRALAVDVMHCLFEGVVKSLMKFWFSPRFSEHPASLIDSINLIDERIDALTPPSSVQRIPRSIQKHLSYWKAHEFKTWFFYYSIPCISDIMLSSYFNHYKLLVLGISLLCQSSISSNDLDIASRALTEFVSMFEHLYYRKSMSNNVHQLLHLTETVRQFGPLWTTTCFPFEDLNGQLIKLVHGSNAAQLQIHHAVSMYVNLTTLKSKKLIPGRPATSFCDSLEYKRGRMKRYLIVDSMYIVGKCTKMDRVPVEINRIFQQQDLCGTSYFYYTRLLKGKLLYSSMEYRRSTRTNSTYVVYFSQPGVTRIGQIRCFVRVTQCFCRKLCDCVAKNYAILEPCLVGTPFSTCIDGTMLSSIHKIREYEGQELAVDIRKLKSVCFYCKIKRRNTFEEYAIEPVNLVESE